MRKFLIIIGSLLALIGVGYVFIKPSFLVHSIDGSTQIITYEFDRQTYTFKSGVGKADVIKSRGYTLRIRDSIVGFGQIALTGSIKVEILQNGNIIQDYEIKPSEQGFYFWNWNKK